MRVASLAVTFILGVAVALAAAWGLSRREPAPAGLAAADVEKVVADYLKRNPDAVVDAIRAFQAREEQLEQESQKAKVAALWDQLSKPQGDPVIGNADSDVTLVEFFDYRCGYCKQVANDVTDLAAGKNAPRIVMREFPILSPDSITAARAALAAEYQGKYLEMHTALMAAGGAFDEARIMEIATEVGLDTERLKTDMNKAEIQATLARNHALAEALGIRGTPAFVTRKAFVPGAISADAMRKMVEDAKG